MPIGGAEVASRAISSKGIGFDDYKMNIRELASRDIGHEPIPFTATLNLFMNKSFAAPGSWAGIGWSSGTWGGKYFYPYLVNIEITGFDPYPPVPSCFFKKSHEGFIFHIYMQTGAEDNRYFIRESFGFKDLRAVKITSNSIDEWKWMTSYNVRGIKIHKDWNLWTDLQNNTEVTINGIRVDVTGVLN